MVARVIGVGIILAVKLVMDEGVHFPRDPGVCCKPCSWVTFYAPLHKEPGRRAFYKYLWSLSESGVVPRGIIQ